MRQQTQKQEGTDQTVDTHDVRGQQYVQSH